MEIIRCNGIPEIIDYIDSWCQKQMTQLDVKTMFLPAGNTVIPLYKKWEKNKPDFLTTLQFYQVDDVITGNKIGIFKKFFQDNLPSYQNQINYIDSKKNTCDLAILGLGLNGHVAFHEPNIPIDFEFGEIVLNDETCNHLDMPIGSKGISYGVQAFLKCEKILLVVSGVSKQKILKELIQKNPKLPASHLLQHKGLTIIADINAYPL